MLTIISSVAVKTDDWCEVDPGSTPNLDGFSSTIFCKDVENNEESWFNSGLHSQWDLPDS